MFEYFHKYVVTAVTDAPRTGGAASQQIQTRYNYNDSEGAAWHFDDNDLTLLDKRTWSQWRGYGRVTVTKGDANGPQTVTETRYMRGMDGDRLPNNGSRDIWVG